MRARVAPSPEGVGRLLRWRHSCAPPMRRPQSLRSRWQSRRVSCWCAATAPVDPLTLVQRGRRLNTDEPAGSEALWRCSQRGAEGRAPTCSDAHLAASGIAARSAWGAIPRQRRRHLTRAIALAPPDAKVNALDAMAVSFAFEGERADQGAPFYQAEAFDLESAERPASAAEQANALGRLYSKRATRRTRRGGTQTGYEMSRRQKDEPGSQLGFVALPVAARAGAHRRPREAHHGRECQPRRRKGARRGDEEPVGPGPRVRISRRLPCAVFRQSRRPRSRRSLVPTSRIRSWCCCRRALQRWRATRRAL